MEVPQASMIAATVVASVRGACCNEFIRNMLGGTSLGLDGGREPISLPLLSKFGI